VWSCRVVLPCGLAVWSCRVVLRQFALQLQLSSRIIRVQEIEVLRSTGLWSAVEAWCDKAGYMR
jgi:hypothetical protein